MFNENIVTKASNFATEAHKGQKRKYTNEPYINHPRSVASMIRQSGGSYEMIAAAWLHDVIEDCEVSYETLVIEFGNPIAAFVWKLTDQAPKSFNRLIRKSWEAGRYSQESYEVKSIKLADLIDNTSSIVSFDPNFAKTYIKEKEILMYSLMGGFADLYKEASRQIKEAKQQLVLE